MSIAALNFVGTLSHPDLGIADRCVLDKLADCHRVRGEQRWPSLRALAVMCWSDKKSICRILDRLEDAKLIIRNRGTPGRTKTTYEIVGFTVCQPVPQKSKVFHQWPTATSEVAHSHLSGGPQPPPNKEYGFDGFDGLKQGGDAPPVLIIPASPPSPATAGATELLDSFHLPETPANTRIVTAAIQAEIKTGKSAAEACKFILAGCQVAQAEGYVIDLLFFNNAKYRAENRRKPNGRTTHGTNGRTERSTERLNQIHANITAGISANLRNRAMANSGEREGDPKFLLGR